MGRPVGGCVSYSLWGKALSLLPWRHSPREARLRGQGTGRFVLGTVHSPEGMRDEEVCTRSRRPQKARSLLRSRRSPWGMRRFARCEGHSPGRIERHS